MSKPSLAGRCDLIKTKWLSKNYEQFSAVDGEITLYHFSASVVNKIQPDIERNQAGD